MSAAKYAIAALVLFSLGHSIMGAAVGEAMQGEWRTAATVGLPAAVLCAAGGIIAAVALAAYREEIRREIRDKAKGTRW